MKILLSRITIFYSFDRSTLRANVARLLLARKKDYPASDLILTKIAPAFPSFPRGYYLQAIVKAALKQNNVPFTDIVTPGIHAYSVWKRNLVAFAPLLFQ